MLNALLASGATTLAARVQAYGEPVYENEDTEAGVADIFWDAYQKGTMENIQRHPDQRAQRALQAICQPLWGVSTRTKLQWRVGLLKVKPGQVNACTPGGGVVFVNDALIPICRNETELITVIGHEIGHVQHRHAIKRLASQRVFERYGNPDIDQRKFWAALKSHQHALIADAIVYRSYERLRELQADAFAVRVVDAAGHDTRQAHTIFQQLDSISPDDASMDTCLISTHPLNRERIQRIQAMAASLPNRAQPKDSREFRELVELTS